MQGKEENVHFFQSSDLKKEGALLWGKGETPFSGRLSS